MEFGNSTMDYKLVQDLSRLGLAVRVSEETSEVFITTGVAGLSGDALLQALVDIASMRPDECDLIEGEIRLWWD